MIDRDKLREIIDLYHRYLGAFATDEYASEWVAYYNACKELCPNTALYITLPALVQALDLPGLLTVEKLYDIILVSELWRGNDE